MNLILSMKKIVASVLYRGGFVSIIRSLTKAGVILGYHRIIPSHSYERSFIQPGMYVTLETFEKHIAYLSKNYSVMGLDCITEDRALPNKCIVTFDDGWADNYKYAFPILKHYGIPATIFIATNKVGTSTWPWPDRICYYIYNAGTHDFMDILKKGVEFLGLSPPGNARNAKNTMVLSEIILEFMKRLDPANLDSLVNHIDSEVVSRYGAVKNVRPWLTWDEVMEMSQSGISFGAHTHNHVILTNMPLDDARSEILLSREILSQKIKKPVKMFCYPNGHFNNEIIDIISNSGYDIAVTTKRGLIEGSPSILNLNRIMIHEDMTSTVPMFACVLTGRIPYF